MWKLAKFMGLPALGVVAVGALAGDARADGMQCGRRLVSTGDPLYKVRSRCGEPDSEQRRSEWRTVRRRVSVPCDEGGRCTRVDELQVEVVIDEWVYDQGPQRFVRYLTFENGRLLRVATGSYGEPDE